MWKKFSKLLESRLLVELGFQFSSLLLWSKVIRLLTEMEEFCLILVFKVVESRVRGWVVLSVVLLSLLLNEDKAEVVVLFGAVVVEEIGTKGGQARLSRAEGGETEIDEQRLLLQVEEAAFCEPEEVMDVQAKLSMVKGMLGVELGIGLEYWLEVLLIGTGRVLVETLADLDDVKGFFFNNFLFSALRVLLSVLDFLRLSERLSIFLESLYSSFSFSLRALSYTFISF